MAKIDVVWWASESAADSGARGLVVDHVDGKVGRDGTVEVAAPWAPPSPDELAAAGAKTPGELRGVKGWTARGGIYRFRAAG